MKRLLAIVLVILLGLPAQVLADSLSITAWSTGDSLNSTNLNSRHTSITTWANGNIADDNIKSSAAIQGSKLDLTTGTGRISNSTSVTSDAPVVTSAQTWNNAVTAFSGWRLNITNTNSASTSRLLDLQVDSTVIASISRVGQLFLNSQNYASGPRTLMDGAWFNVASATYTDNVTAASGTAPRFIAYAFQRPAVAAANTAVTTTDAATVFIASAPVAGTNMTLGNRWALWIPQGDVLIGGNLEVRGSVAVPRGYIASFTIANNSSDATNDIDVQPGVARDDTDSGTIRHTTTLVKRTDAIFGIGTNQGCLDTGTVGNGTYHIFAIASAGSTTPDVICSLSATSPAVPHTDWASRRRIGSILRESGAIVGFSQRGDTFLRSTPVNDISTSTLGTGDVSFTLSVPAGIQVEALLVGRAGATAAQVYVQSPDMTSSPASAAMSQFNVTAAQGQSAALRIRTNTARVVNAKSSAASTALDMSTEGWIDWRGKDN